MKPIKKEGFCIYCHKAIPFNPVFPTCATCGGTCSMTMRFSSTEESASYCHGCGEPAYVSASNPLCDDCQKKTP